MAKDDHEALRRSVLKSSGIAVAGLLGASGSVAASRGRGNSQGQGRGDGRGGEQGPPGHAGEQGPPEHAGDPGPPSWVNNSDGQLEMGASRAEWEAAPEASEIEGIPAQARVVPYDAAVAAIDSLNTAMENGDVEITSNGSITASDDTGSENAEAGAQ